MCAAVVASVADARALECAGVHDGCTVAIGAGDAATDGVAAHGAERVGTDAGYNCGCAAADADATGTGGAGVGEHDGADGVAVGATVVLRTSTLPAAAAAATTVSVLGTASAVGIVVASVAAHRVGRAVPMP